MTSDNVDVEVKRLRRTGETIRAIAERLGLSKSRVGRIVADDDDDDELEDDDDLDDRELALLNATTEGRYRPQAPFRFVGMEPDDVGTSKASILAILSTSSGSSMPTGSA